MSRREVCHPVFAVVSDITPLTFDFPDNSRRSPPTRVLDAWAISRVYSIGRSSMHNRGPHIEA